MTDNRDIHGRNGTNCFGEVDATFQFDGLGATVLDQTTGILACLGKIDLVREKRHICNNQRL